jgi:prepilin-type N-terminal cleavage/methylation domain-containing protein
MKMFRKDEGFTLVELMVVVLIIGILVAIAVPVFLNASANAQAKSCQANQRTWNGALQTYNANAGTPITITAGFLGSGTMASLFGTANTATIKTIPKCPAGLGAAGHLGEYWVDGAGVIISDQGATAASWPASTSTHQLP